MNTSNRKTPTEEDLFDPEEDHNLKPLKEPKDNGKDSDYQQEASDDDSNQ